MSRYYLGVDGGQSSTIALVANERGEIVGVGRSGPCNHVSGSEARARFLSVLSNCLAEALRTLDLENVCPQFAAACLGFSGGAEDKAAYSQELIRTDHLKVTHDAEIALSGATEGEPGIIVIAGTGSIAYGRNAALESARAGGWGYIFGDEGGAFDIVRRALRASLKLEEGWGPATSLHGSLLAATGAASANQLLHRFYAHQDRKPIAELAPLITGAADSGDTVAQEIIREAAAALGEYAAAVHKKLFAENSPVPVAQVGGVFRSAFLRLSFSRYIRDNLGCETSFPRLSPPAGALLEALRMDGNQSRLSGLPSETKI